jgi:glycosyltransferase involved in cell wall biosynthesis
MTASIIICTRNRESDLRDTLESLASVRIPSGLSVELLVIDNGSIDSTAEVVQGFHPASISVRYLYEPRRGQCFARNTGLSACLGDIILFTDDDLRFPLDWLEKMCDPIQAGIADGVAGSVRIPPKLQRDWMTAIHVSCFAWDFSRGGESVALIGANMAFARRVLERVAGFDVELGPGRLGFSDDVLFTWQMVAAGFRLHTAGECFVEHHFDPNRLRSTSMRDRADRQGRVEAYLEYHWLHGRVTLPFLKCMFLALMVQLARHLVPDRQEGCSAWEFRLRTKAAFHRQICIERQRPRNYAHRGLLKRRGETYELRQAVVTHSAAEGNNVTFPEPA